MFPQKSRWFGLVIMLSLKDTGTGSLLRDVYISVGKSVVPLRA